MSEKKQMGRTFLGFLRVVIAAYMITGVMLLLFSLVLYQWQLSEGLMAGGTLAIYILSCFVAGLFIGKSGRNRSFAWGLLSGVVYYLVLLALALIVAEPEKVGLVSVFVNLSICAASGMLGAMAFRR